MDRFFDCCNVRNTVEWKQKLKDNLKPYSSLDDARFEFFKDILVIFYEWRREKRDSKFSKGDKMKMFISQQTYEGMVITSKSMVECVVKFVLMERFCQDDLENYFGRQREIGQRKDNHRVVHVGYNDNTIKCQYTVQPISGKVRLSESKWSQISDTPLKKRKKNST